MENEHTPQSVRLASIDALRGFDMFFITGGSAMILGICAALGCSGGALAAQMKHVEWEGLTQHDTIFPLFLFLAGVSWPFSLASRRARGCGTGAVLAKIASRAAVLFLIGLSFGGAMAFKPDFRLMGVLQFIGLSWGVAATAFVFLRGRFAIAAVAGLALAAYYALLHFCIAPGAPAGASSYSPEWNIVSWLDMKLWPSHVVAKWRYEPESLFSVPSGAALALLGMFAGAILRDDGAKPSLRKAGLLAGASAVCAAAAWCFSSPLADPVVKKLWTASFVLWSASISFGLLAVFYAVVDVLGFRAWTVAFDPVGKNSILAYLFMMTGCQHALKKLYLPGICEISGVWGDAVAGLGSYLIVWAVLLWLRGRKAFLKV